MKTFLEQIKDLTDNDAKLDGRLGILVYRHLFNNNPNTTIYGRIRQLEDLGYDFFVAPTYEDSDVKSKNDLYIYKFRMSNCVLAASNLEDPYLTELRDELRIQLKVFPKNEW